MFGDVNEKVGTIAAEVGKTPRAWNAGIFSILIISDMEFDWCTQISSRRVDARLFDELSKWFGDRGCKLPRLVFWNVNSRAGTIPVRQNELGVALVSGFSVNVAKMVMSGNIFSHNTIC